MKKKKKKRRGKEEKRKREKGRTCTLAFVTFRATDFFLFLSTLFPLPIAITVNASVDNWPPPTLFKESDHTTYSDHILKKKIKK